MRTIRVRRIDEASATKTRVKRRYAETLLVHTAKLSRNQPMKDHLTVERPVVLCNKRSHEKEKKERFKSG